VIAVQARVAAVFLQTEAVHPSDSAQSGNPNWNRPAVLTIQYLGCLITVRGEIAAGAGVRGSYQIVPASQGTVSAFEHLGVAAISSDVIDATSLQHICEWAKCEIDFLLEAPF
jgi:hypothetical protein